MMSKWDFQQEANITAFLEEEEYKLKKEFFLKFSEVLNERKIRWALFCSSSLFFMGLVDDFNDFDILVHRDDVNMAISSLEEISNLKSREIYGIEIDIKSAISEEEIKIIERIMKKLAKNGFSSSHYANFEYETYSSMDMISGFGINAMDIKYMYTYNSNELINIKIENMDIPIVCPEAQFVLYAIMELWQPQRRWKREILQQYVCENNLKHRQIADNSLHQRIPGHIKKKIREVLL